MSTKENVRDLEAQPGLLFFGHWIYFNSFGAFVATNFPKRRSGKGRSLLPEEVAMLMGAVAP